MQSDELRNLLRCEDDRTEWKLSPKDNDILHAVCAMANDLGNTQRPGYIVIGVDAKTGQPKGVGERNQLLDQEQTRLAGRIGSIKLFPTPAFDVQVVEIDGVNLVVIRVDPYPVPPIVTVDGVAWVRHGSTTVRASTADQDRLRERRPLNRQPFDIRPFSGATLDDVDVKSLRTHYDAAQDLIEDNEEFPNLEAWLTQSKLGIPYQGRWTPNAAAILMFGKSPQSFLPGATVEFVRYGGGDVEAPIVDRKPITGTLPDQLEATWALMNAHLVDVPSKSEGIRSSFVPEYPIAALKELIRNMIQHRTYEGTNAPCRVEWFSDHIEISNPGGPFGRASEGPFGTHSDYRNPTITEWLKNLGYVEQLARGIRLVHKQLARNGNPELEVETDGFTRITVRRTQ